MNKKYKYLVIIFLIFASFIAFGRIAGNDFVNYDDPRLITGHNIVKSGFNAESIKWALTNASDEYWHPLTWLAIMLEWQLFGENATGYHFVSLFFHIGAVLFLFLFLNKATKQLWPSAFAAALFALHPLRVESVAWASELKDVLSMFFGMATLYAYAFYVEKPQISKYAVCFILFVLSLMCKPMLITLPCVMLLLDYWPFARWQNQSVPVNIPVETDKKTGKKKSKQHKDTTPMEKKLTVPVKSQKQVIANLLLEKVPFFLLIIVLTVMYIWQLRENYSLVSLDNLLFSDRLINAVVSYVIYLRKFFWPVDLAVFYPYQSVYTLWQIFGSAFILTGITIAVVMIMKKAPFLFVGWFWYLGTLSPVIGLLQAGFQSMADRYTYFPSIGIALMLTWGLFYLVPKEKMQKKILLPAAGIVLFILTILTWQQCGYWKNSISLFSHALKVTEDNFIAHNNLGTALADLGKNDEAIAHFREFVKIYPDNFQAHFNLGAALANNKKYDEAVIQYLKVIKLNPDYDAVHYNLANLFMVQGKAKEAIAHYLEAIKINPANASAHFKLGVHMAAKGKQNEAITHYLAVIKIDPVNDSAYYNLANLLMQQGKNEEAIARYLEAIEINPNYDEAHYNLAALLIKNGDIDQAIVHFREAAPIKPSFKVLNNLGVHLEKQFRHDEAIHFYRLALPLEPKNPGLHFNLGISLGNKGEMKEAIEHFRRAISLKPDYQEARQALKLALELEQQKR